MTKKRKKPGGTPKGEIGSNPELLPWWYDLVTSAAVSPVVDRLRTVFTNRSLRFDKIKAVGFDFDHTLAVYNSDALDTLAMELVIDRLVKKEGIPRSSFSDLPSPEFARTGLIVDVEKGTVLKIDRYGHVTRGFRGRSRLTTQERRKLYGDQDVIPHVTFGNRFVQVDSPFTKPEVRIFATLAAKKKDGKCTGLWKKIRRHTDMIHRDGSLKKILTSDPLKYLKPDLKTVPMLQKLKEDGKKVFLLTNSEWEYTRRMVNPALGLGEGEDLGWIDLFDAVVTDAHKPHYFESRRSRTDAPASTEHPLVKKRGNIHFLEKAIGARGNEVLYVGDHIYSDLITSKRRKQWRTMLIIPDLEEEMAAQALLPGLAAQLQQADERRVHTEREVRHWDAMESSMSKLSEQEFEQVVDRIQSEIVRNRRAAVRTLKQEIQLRERLRKRISDTINRSWGSLFRANQELTYYGKQVEDFACAYTSRATNLNYYPTNHYFRSRMDYLPHELETM